MKRGLLIGVGTLGGLGAVFAITPPQFGTSGPTGLSALPGKAPATSTPTPAATNSATPTKTSKPNTPTTKPTNKPTKSPAPQPAQTTPAASTGVSGTFDGNTAQTRWGPVQVRLVVKDGKIVDASALQSPSGDSRSRSISSQAIPYLVQETLAAQSDQISGVGGASYTSTGWFTSLQSALKKAGL
ncbi:FMN-binding [actinobacterium SCGC AAA044-D11]|uniref:Unannotated protein n=1 Tax=freshwater metagenome TaxID=449393 RepID=A0A6J6HFF5_9ZZZZ|nr:FMN-binding protein [Actinomycetota bacterium]MTA24854.1 FMN-binding protein [Actinomycetota bacterium]